MIIKKEIKERNKDSNVVYRTENLEVDLSVVQIVTCVQIRSGSQFSVKRITAFVFVFLLLNTVHFKINKPKQGSVC